MLLEFHTCFSRTNAPLAFESLFFMSFIPPPSLHTVAPKYVNCSTSSMSCPLNLMASWFRAFILITLVLSMLILSPTLLASWSSLVVLSCICCLVEEKSDISSAKSRSSIFDVNRYLMPFSPFPTAFLITQSITIKNINPDILHPCFTPVLMLNHTPTSPWSSTAH